MWQLWFRAVWMSQNHRVNRPCPNSDVLPHEKAARLPLTLPLANLWIGEQNLSSGQVWQPPAVAQRVETLQIIQFISKKLVLLYMFHGWCKWKKTSRFVSSAPVFGCICKLHLLAILLLINAPFRKGEISFLLTLPRHDLVKSFLLRKARNVSSAKGDACWKFATTSANDGLKKMLYVTGQSNSIHVGISCQATCGLPIVPCWGRDKPPLCYLLMHLPQCFLVGKQSSVDSHKVLQTWNPGL